MSADGPSKVKQAEIIGGEAQQVRRWRRRWEAKQPAIAAAEDVEPAGEIDDFVLSALSDAPGRGRKPTFTAEQVAQIIAVACEHPSNNDREVSHWTRKEQANEVVKRGIVPSISPRHIERRLDEAGVKPHHFRCRLNAKIKETDPKGCAPTGPGSRR